MFTRFQRTLTSVGLSLGLIPLSMSALAQRSLPGINPSLPVTSGSVECSVREQLGASRASSTLRGRLSLVDRNNPTFPSANTLSYELLTSQPLNLLARDLSSDTPVFWIRFARSVNYSLPSRPATGSRVVANLAAGFLQTDYYGNLSEELPPYPRLGELKIFKFAAEAPQNPLRLSVEVPARSVVRGTSVFPSADYNATFDCSFIDD